MTFFNASHMPDILDLTQRGRLGAATALIQRSLGSNLGQPQAEGGGARPHHDGQEARLPAPAAFADAPSRPAAEGARPTPSPAASGSFTRHAFRGARGSLDYLLYAPANATKAMPLVMMLHGCTQDAEDFARGTRMNQLAEEFGFLVAYPEQTRKANAQKCWNWFRPGDQGKGSGEPALIAGIAGEIANRHDVDRGRIYVAGLSAGGAAAAIMAQAYPDVFAAAGIHSGLACGSAADLPGALSAMKGKGRRRSVDGQTYVPLITFHGSRDTTVDPANSEQIHGSWRERHTAASLAETVETGVSPGGRQYRQAVLRGPSGKAMAESWLVMGAGHAWSGGSPSGSYTDASGPDASRAMIRFFLQHRLGGPATG
ncbi:PHB depolymerase family esterase [Erythrobacter arachoides]|uniref:PHB depolymerase family esterase n=1 Tax=Aurantiacibacter arachoides TaxID=1850444 RepID=A0A845A1G1_9SPHN|nr:PHB depolymerase family esterase [Aurantiacibacter arachoides]MXO94381.1 PHB depolymerase family esterase [Aurantiacibacter arachoides]GGD63919.1 esterase [Aurantiacibacter arachoides]